MNVHYKKRLVIGQNGHDQRPYIISLFLESPLMLSRHPWILRARKKVAVRHQFFGLAP